MANTKSDNPKKGTSLYILVDLPALLDKLALKRMNKNAGAAKLKKPSHSDLINEGAINLLKKEGILTKGHPLYD